MSTIDHRKFLECFLPVENVLKAYLLSATGDPHASADLLQEVASVLWEKFEQYEEDRPFRNWALGIARLQVLKWRQHLARSREMLSPEVLDKLADTAAEHGCSVDERIYHLRHCIGNLKEKTRKILKLRYWQALPIRKIAETLGKSEVTIEMFLVRTRRLLRQCVERRLARPGKGVS